MLGTDAIGSGLQLLPLIGGLVVGAALAPRAVRLAGAKVTLADAYRRAFLGATTGVGSGRPVRGGGWMALAGPGTGAAITTASAAALCELTTLQMSRQDH